MELIAHVQELYSSSKSNQEYRQKVQEENIRDKYNKLVDETKLVLLENRESLSNEDKGEIEKVQKEIDKMYNRIWWKGMRF